MFLQEMTEIVRAIYDMMGKYTYPALKGDVPKQHVDAFFEVRTKLILSLNVYYMSAQTNRFSLVQKMDRNKDGVVTLEEFVLACQEVNTALK